MAAFAPARALYLRFGFEVCGPFAAYRTDPYSEFMALNLAADLPALEHDLDRYQHRGARMG